MPQVSIHATHYINFFITVRPPTQTISDHDCTNIFRQFLPAKKVIVMRKIRELWTVENVGITCGGLVYNLYLYILYLKMVIYIYFWH